MLRRFAPLLLVVVAACNDPGGVGAGLIDSVDGAPEVVTLSPTAFEPVGDADVTGGTARFLLGETVDPDLGAMRATAWVDFSAPASLSDAFRNGTVTRASLVLKASSEYGYAGTLTRASVRAIDAEWFAVGSTADSTIASGALITDFEFSSDAATVEIPLPASWVSAWDAALRATTFGGSFHGFALAASEARAVTGFDMTGTVIRAYAGGDSAYFPALSNFTRIEADAPPARGDGKLAFQDGRSGGLRLAFDFSDPRLAMTGLARAVVAIEADTSLAAAVPPGFVRPIARTLTIDAVSEDPPARLTVGTASMIDGVYYLEQSELFEVLRRASRGDSVLDYFIVRAPLAENGLGSVLLGGSRPPVAFLTVLKAQ